MKSKGKTFFSEESTQTFSNSKLFWMSTSEGPATDIGFVTPYCFADGRGGESPNPFELTIAAQNTKTRKGYQNEIKPNPTPKSNPNQPNSPKP